MNKKQRVYILFTLCLIIIVGFWLYSFKINLNNTLNKSNNDKKNGVTLAELSNTIKNSFKDSSLVNPNKETLDNLKQRLAEEIKSQDTSDWQTYINEEYGFEFKYPKEWVINNEIHVPSEHRYNLFIQDKQGKYCCLSGGPAPREEACADCLEVGGLVFGLQIVKNVDNLSLEKIGERYGPSYALNIANQIAVLDGRDEGACSPPYWVIEKDGYLYSFRITSMLGKKYDSPFSQADEEKYFNQILSTFKFTD